MILSRVEIPATDTLFVTDTVVRKYREVEKVDDDVDRLVVIERILEVVNYGIRVGWVYANPTNHKQCIVYAEMGEKKKPWWFVIAPSDPSHVVQIKNDWVIVTMLNHRHSRFQEAIEEHLELTNPEKSTCPTEKNEEDTPS